MRRRTYLVVAVMLWLGCGHDALVGPPVPPSVPPAAPPRAGNHAPIASAGGPYQGVEADVGLQFDARASKDPDGDSLTYAWDLGAPGYVYGYPKGPRPNVTYLDDGVYTATVIATDSWGASDTATAQVHISNVA